MRFVIVLWCLLGSDRVVTESTTIPSIRYPPEDDRPFATEAPDFSGITDDLVRNITQQFRHHCPYTELCTITNVNDTHNFEEGTEACCAACKCERECLETNDCCPDVIPELLNTKRFMNHDIDVYKCIPAMIRPDVDADTDGVKAIAKCPESFADTATTVDIRTKCETVYATFSLLHDPRDIVPVTDNKTLATYKNSYCAICDGIPTTELVLWKAIMQCDMRDLSSDVMYGNPFGQLRDEITNCARIDFAIPGELVHRSIDMDTCVIHTDRCNVTGTWQQYDEVVERACHSYTSYYKQYKNIHCYFCNGFYEGQIEHICKHLDPGSKVGSFVALLDFNNLENIDNDNSVEDDGHTKCPTGSVYDSYTETCLVRHCPAFTMMTNGNCKSMFTKFLDTIAFDVVFRLIPESTDKLHMTDLWEMRNTVFDSIFSRVDIASAADIYICNIEMFLKFPVPKAEQQLQMTSDADHMYTTNIKHIGVRVRFTTDVERETTVLVKNVMNIMEDIEHSYTNWTMQFALFDNDLFKESNFIYLNSGPFLKVFPSGTVSPGLYEEILTPIDWYTLKYAFPDPIDGLAINPIQPLSLYYETVDTCEYAVEITPGHFTPKVEIYINKLTTNITLEDFILELELNISDVVYSETVNGSKLFVSESAYLNGVSHLFSEQKRRSKETYNAEWIISVVCSTVAIFSLLATFITYCFFESIRTIPGINNMTLVLSLFATQTLYLIVSSVEIKSENMCAYIGMGLHFTLVCSFFYMFICTFHMFRVFASIERIGVKQSYMMSLKYGLFAVLLALLVVVSTAVYSLVTTNMDSFGYGGHTCYISNPEMIKYAVAVPLGCVIVANLVMFVFVIIKVSKMPNMSKSKNHERNNIIIFIKLSTITGLTWVFAFIYQWVNMKVFSYLFIVLSSSQGVFIMFSFVVNKRTFNMIKDSSVKYVSTLKQTRSFFTKSSKQSKEK